MSACGAQPRIVYVLPPNQAAAGAGNPFAPVSVSRLAAPYAPYAPYAPFAPVQAAQVNGPRKNAARTTNNQNNTIENNNEIRVTNTQGN